MASEDPSLPLRESQFWRKITRHSKAAGRILVQNALILYFTLKDPDTPLWARGAILSALAYFISPLDLIPDFIPMAGYSDDLTALVTAVGAVAVHVKKAHRDQARELVERWFGA